MWGWSIPLLFHFPHPFDACGWQEYKAKLPETCQTRHSARSLLHLRQGYGKPNRKRTLKPVHQRTHELTQTKHHQPQAQKQNISGLSPLTCLRSLLLFRAAQSSGMHRIFFDPVSDRGRPADELCLSTLIVNNFLTKFNGIRVVPNADTTKYGRNLTIPEIQEIMKSHAEQTTYLFGHP